MTQISGEVFVDGFPIAEDEGSTVSESDGKESDGLI